MIWYEHRSGLRRSGPPVLVTEADLENRTGFRSIYGFDDATKDIIQEQRGSYGLSGQKLFSSCLFIDIDSNDALAAEITRTLLEKQIAFEKFHTGGRGWHFHIPITPMEGADVAYRQKRWVEHHFPGADLSLYKTSGIIRLPGTFHSKCVGQRKLLVESHSGNILTIDLKVLPPDTRGLWSTGEEYETEEILDCLLMRRLREGGRNNGIFTIAMLCGKVGYTHEQTKEIVTKYNENMVEPPVSEQELVTTVKSAYRGA